MIMMIMNDDDDSSITTNLFMIDDAVYNKWQCELQGIASDYLKTSFKTCFVWDNFFRLTGARSLKKIFWKI